MNDDTPQTSTGTQGLSLTALDVLRPQRDTLSVKAVWLRGPASRLLFRVVNPETMRINGLPIRRKVGGKPGRASS